MGIRWVRDSAEYVAAAKQAYHAAEMAMPAMVADKNWSAMPDQDDAAHLPPAVILDIDQTALTNPHFQAQLEPPFSETKLNDWSIAHDGTPVPGVIAFAKQAEIYGVAVFFMTNRACVADPESKDPCPQKEVVIQDLLEAGLPATAENVSLSGNAAGLGCRKLPGYSDNRRRSQRLHPLRQAATGRAMYRGRNHRQSIRGSRRIRCVLGRRLVHPAEPDARFLDLRQIGKN
jgi:acid phosphatase